MMNWKKPLLAVLVGALAACGDGTPAEITDSGNDPTDLGNNVPEDTGNTTPTDTGNTTPKDTGSTTPEDTGSTTAEDTGSTTPEDSGTTPSEDVPAPPVDVPPTCTGTEMVCGGGCVDTQTSAAHCGRCDNACPTGELCMAGACRPSMTCTGSQTLCGGGCVDTQTSATHCGRCDNACAAGQRCSAGACVAERMCPTGQSDCTPSAATMTCVDTQTSTANCGACGNACATGESCAMGVCQPAACPSGQTRCTAMGVATCVNTMTDNANCGTCGTACPTGEACMSGACRPTCAAPRQTCTVDGMPTCLDVQTDSAHCGNCTTICNGGQTCTAGRCACPTGRTACGATCVNTQTDNANCGACGTRCGTGQSCTSGRCACPTGQTLCGTTCVDTGSDLANCGRCANRCTAPATCSMGTCNSLCGAGTTSCGGRCVATSTFQTDRANCGRCGNACATGNVCVAGICRPSNDVRANAITMVPNAAREVTVTGTTVNATFDGPTVPCGCSSGANVWYRFTIPGEGVVYFDTAGSAYDTSLFLTNNAGTAVPGQAGSGFSSLGLCNDDSGCGTGGGFTSGLQSRTAGLLAGGTYYVAVGGCGTGTFTLRMQYLPRNVARDFANARLTGTGNTGTQTLQAGSVTAGTCGGASGAERASWFLTCGATADRQLFSTCRSDPGAFFIRRQTNSSTVNYDPVAYVRSAQTGAQVNCNDDGSGTGVDCRGVIPLFQGLNVGALDNLQRGSRLSGLSTPRGLGVVYIDTLGTSQGMRYNMRFETQ